MPFYDIIQNLLVERFHLVSHHEIANFPGYELVVDKGGSKLKEVTSDPDPPRAQGTVGRAPIGSDGFPIIPGRPTLRSRTLRVHHTQVVPLKRSATQNSSMPMQEINHLLNLRSSATIGGAPTRCRNSCQPRPARIRSCHSPLGAGSCSSIEEQ